MKKFNLLRKSERKSVGTTLALTVGSPSVHRRYSALKHLTFMLLFLLGSLNVWGGEITYTFNSKSWGATSGGSAANWTSGRDGAGFSNNGIQVTTAASGANGTSPISFTNVTKVVCTYNTNTSKGKGTIDVQVGTNDAKSVNWAYSGSASGTSANFTAIVNYATAETGNVKITLNTSTNSIYLVSVTITTQSSNPEVNVSPASWDFGTVHASAEASKVFSVSGSNLTAGNLTLTVPDGFSVDPSSIAVDGTLAATNVTVSKNTSTEDDYAGNLSISGGGLASAKTVALTMTVDADPEPTGTFELFSGDLEEGDYVICSGTTALKNALATNTNYIGYESVEINNDEVENPSNDLVWHIAQSGEYWTIYNVTANNYAASTGAKNRGQVIADGTDDKAKWTVSGNSSYEFVNKANTAASVNSNLRYNSGYGFACYSTSTGSSLSLYKKQVAGQPKAPTFSVEGENYESAQSVELSCETEGATIYYTTNGDAPTSSSTQYNGTAITVDHTMTIKAIAIKNEISSTVASATYTIIVWQTVADVWDDITADGPTNAHIYGYVSQINVGGYDNNFYISDNGSTEGNQLYAYRMNMNSFSVAVGDKVKLAGDLTEYQGTKEFKYANSGATQGLVVALEAKGALQSVAVSGTATKKTYSANETFETAGLVVTATYANGFSEVVTEGITWGDDLTDHKVAESTTVQVTATVGGVISAAYDVEIEVSTKALVSIALSADEFEVYQGLELPKPTVTATYSEGDPEDVTALAEFTGYNKNTPGEQTITVSYSFGTGDPIEETYTVTVKPIYNVELPASVAKGLIETAVGETESTEDMIVRGIVSHINNASNNVQTYWISDDGTRTNEVEIFKGKYLSGANFTTTNQLKVGDEVVVKGKVVYYNSTTPEFANGKSQLQSLARTPNFEVEAVTGFEVGSDDLAVADLNITQDGEGEVTLASSNNTDAVTIVDGNLHAVAAGTATITANLVADGIYKAATYEFSVTVIPAQVKYAITFDSNGADGGSAPEAIADKAAGAEVTLPANAWTKIGHTFNGWKVINNTTSEEVEVEAGVFTMPASAVTIQAKWAEISVWATTYTSNVTLSYTGTGESNSKVIINEAEYPAQKVGSSSNDGSVVVTVPSGTHTLHFHAVAWNGKSVTITASGVENMSVSSFPLIADAGFKASGTYTLENDPVDQYFAMTFDAVAEETQITFSKTDGDDKRFLLYGVNQEGGVLPASIAANPASISFGSVEQNASVAAKTINVTLTSVNSATVTLAGDNAFSIDKTSLTANGIIMVTPNTTATIGAHNATITISDDDEAAEDVVVNVSMTVTEPVINDDVTGTWNLVTDAAALKAGMQVIVASVADGEGALYTLGGPNGASANNRIAVAGTASSSVLTPAAGTKVLTLVDAGEGKFALQLTNGNYLYAQGGNSNNCLKERSDINNQATWTITIEEGIATIKADVSGRNWMRKNTNSAIFSCYASGQENIVLYAKPFDYEREGLQQGMLGTICLPNGGQIFGASIFEIAYMDYEANGITPYKIYFDEVEGGIMEAGMPYVILANEGSSHLGVYYTDSENKAAQSKKGLVGYMDESGRTLAENEYFIYNNMFYYVSAADAASGRIHISKNHAFINLSAVPGYNNEPISVPAPGRRVSIGNGAPAVATGLENGELKSDEMKKVLINGELFIIRGEKMYDATGRLVK